MSVATEQNKGVTAVLSVRNFRLLWTGQTISQIGDGLTNLAILIMINRLTGSSAALAIMMIVIGLPQLLIGLVSGVLVDRWDRKRIMVVSDLLRGLLVLGFLFVQRPEDVWIFYILGFLQAAVGTFFTPAKSAMIPAIIEKDALLAANALSQTTQVITGVVGSALAGVLVALTGSAWLAFSLDGCSFILSAVFISRIEVSQQAGIASGGVSETLNQLVDGLRYIFSRRMLVGVMTTFAVTMLGLGPVNVLIIPLLVNHLKVPTEALGIIDAAQVVGMVLGSTLVAVLAARLKSNQIIVAGIMLVGVSVGLFGASPLIGLSLISLFFVGLFITPVQAAAAAVLQGTIPDDKRGRANAAMNTVITLASVISMACSGFLGDALGIRQVFYLAGAITVFAGLLAALLMRQPEPKLTLEALETK